MSRKSKQIAGKIYGDLTAIAFSHIKEGKHYWLCRCSCGKKVTRRKTELMAGLYVSCGDCFAERPTIRNNAALKKTHAIWSGIKQRCYNPNSSSYRSYNKKGIKMCTNWKNSFNAFLDDMGPQPPGQTLGRFNLKKGFNKDNCFWAYPAAVLKARYMLADQSTSQSVYTLNMTADLKNWCTGQGPEKIRDILESARLLD